MNAKGLVLASALLASIATSPAAMYTRVILPGVCNLIANELNHPMGNSLANVLSTAPAVPLTLSKYNPSTGNYDAEQYDPDLGGWFPGTMTLNPGEAAFLDSSSPAAFVVTFKGALPPDQSCASLVGCRPGLLSRRMGWNTTGLGPSGYRDLVGFDPMEGSTVYRLTGGNCRFLGPPDYNVYTFAHGAWTPAPPMIDPGEAVWVQVPVSIPTVYTKAIVPGVCNLIANELNACRGNNVNNVLPPSSLPLAAITLSKFIPGSAPSFETEAFDPDVGTWIPGTMTLNPGDGVLLDSPVAFTATFRGVSPSARPDSCTALAAGQRSLLSRRAGGLGPSTYEQIVGSAPVAGSTLYRFVPGGDCSVFAAPNYTVYTYAASGWAPATPSIPAGESVWVELPIALPTSYTKAILPGLCNLVANELNACGGNNVNNVLPPAGLPPGIITLHKFIPGGPPTYETETFDPAVGTWNPGTMIWNPGDGVFVDSTVAFNATFRGTLPLAKPFKCLVGGRPHLLSRRSGGIGPSTYEDIVGAPPMAGSTLYRFVPGGDCNVLAAPNYTVHTYAGGAWAPAPPLVPPGDSVYVQVPVSSSQTLTITRTCSRFVIELTWSGDWQLESANSITGPWSRVPSATSPLYWSTLPPPAARFFRLACP